MRAVTLWFLCFLFPTPIFAEQACDPFAALQGYCGEAAKKAVTVTTTPSGSWVPEASPPAETPYTSCLRRYPSCAAEHCPGNTADCKPCLDEVNACAGQ